ncbi:hypothetical protein FRB95_013702 [Tulasnella sp. JGI-2019a]|nr:hypothetical protein FRB95_013702 [Tulasnella sp. JGI-2019a]
MFFCTFKWGESHLVSKAKITDILQALLTSLASPDSESLPNTLVLIAHTPQNTIERLQELKVKLPSNVLIVDIAHYERQLFNSRNPNTARSPHQTLSLPNMLLSHNVPVLSPFNNSGNDAFYSLLMFQYLIDPEGTRIPPPKVAKRDGLPMVVPSAAVLPTTQVYGNGPGSVGTGPRPRNAHRLSVGTEKELSFNPGVVVGGPNGWQGRLSMFNGSMPTFSPSQSGGIAGGSSTGAPFASRGRSSISLTGPNVTQRFSGGTESAETGASGGGSGGERRSVSTARSGQPMKRENIGAGGAGGRPRSDSAAPYQTQERNAAGAHSPKLSSKPQTRGPNSSPNGSGQNSPGFEPSVRENSQPTTSPSGFEPIRPPRRNQPQRRQDNSEDDFQPPQAPFAREAAMRNARSKSYDDHQNPGSSPTKSITNYSRQNSITSINNLSSNVSTPTSPSIMVTDHGSQDTGLNGGGRGSGRGTGGSSALVSLNDPPRSRSEALHSDSGSTKGKKEGLGGGGFFANTIKRFSMKP